jgi:ABC-type nitrate/sulfonate/bicarbonate transport system permease component
MVFAYILVMLGIGLVLDATMRKFQSHFLNWAEESST